MNTPANGQALAFRAKAKKRLPAIPSATSPWSRCHLAPHPWLNTQVLSAPKIIALEAQECMQLAHIWSFDGQNATCGIPVSCLVKRARYIASLPILMNFSGRTKKKHRAVLRCFGTTFVSLIGRTLISNRAILNHYFHCPGENISVCIRETIEGVGASSFTTKILGYVFSMTPSASIIFLRPRFARSLPACLHRTPSPA
jgi:hypothetical protein